MFRVAMQIFLCFVFFSCPLLTASYFMSQSSNASQAVSFDAKGMPLVFLNTADKN